MAGGHAWQGGGAWMPCTPLTLRDTVGQWAGGTHPTGMHRCSVNAVEQSNSGYARLNRITASLN